MKKKMRIHTYICTYIYIYIYIAVLLIQGRADEGTSETFKVHPSPITLWLPNAKQGYLAHKKQPPPLEAP